jgi:hypothetical protein
LTGLERTSNVRSKPLGLSLPSKVIKDKLSGQKPENFGKGQTIIVEYRWAEGDEACLRDMAAELVQLGVDEGAHHAVYALQGL